MRITSRGLLAVLMLAAILAPVPASAQFGKLVKKAKEAAGIDKLAPTATSTTASTDQAAGPIRVNPAFELTQASLDRFATALAAERASRQETLKLIASMKSREEYATCSQGVAGSPAYLKIYNAYIERAGGAKTPEEQQAIGKKLSDDMGGLLTEKCGVDPGNYPESQRESMVRSRAREAALQQSGLEGRIYAVLKERIIPFCTADAATRSAAEVRVPGQGRGIYFIYLPSEAATLEPRCAALMSGLQAVS